MAANPPTAPAKYVWQTCLDVEGQDAGHYLDFVNKPLLDIVTGTPRCVLELGCAAGAAGVELKRRYPNAKVIGVEASRAAADVAATRIDQVICSRLEDVDFAAAGIQHGEVDVVIAGDVLEHVFNPWDVLVRMKPFLAPKAQVAASIPNVRNAVLIAALANNGRWQYRERGLLDITHVRFFTLQEIRNMFSETGYEVEGYSVIVSRPLIETWKAHKDDPKVTLELGRLRISDLTPTEFRELCAEQFLVSARPA